MTDTLFERVAVLLPDGSVLRDGFVGVSGSRISHVGPTRPDGDVSSAVTGPGLVLIPGLVNAHTHVPMSLLRGFADDHELHDWLFNFIFPAEARLDDRLVGLGARLSMLEMAAGGTTCFIDMYDHCMAIAEAADEAGLSANLSRGCTMIGNDPVFENSRCFREMRELVERWHGHDGGRIRIDASIHAEYTSDEKYHLPLARYASENGLRLHIHISETRKEHEECKARNNGLTPVQVMERSGLWAQGGVAAHCVWVEDGDMDILAARGVSAVHNPVSNFKLASGAARVPDMRARGVSVALGTDGMASNNSHDMFEEMKLAAMAQMKIGAVTAGDSLAMATGGGAEAAGRGTETGRIEVGCYADLALLDFDSPHLTPCHHIPSQLVYAARAGDVRLTMARGKVVYRDGEFLTLDRERILYEAKLAARIF